MSAADLSALELIRALIARLHNAAPRGKLATRLRRAHRYATHQILSAQMRGDKA